MFTIRREAKLHLRQMLKVEVVMKDGKKTSASASASKSKSALVSADAIHRSNTSVRKQQPQEANPDVRDRPKL